MQGTVSAVSVIFHSQAESTLVPKPLHQKGALSAKCIAHWSILLCNPVKHKLPCTVADGLCTVADQAHLVYTVGLLHQQVHRVHPTLDHGDSWLSFSTGFLSVGIVLLNSTDHQLFGNLWPFAVACRVYVIAAYKHLSLDRTEPRLACPLFELTLCWHVSLPLIFQDLASKCVTAAWRHDH